MRKLERQDRRKGRGADPELEWLVAHQEDGLEMLAGASKDLSEATLMS